MDLDPWVFPARLCRPPPPGSAASPAAVSTAALRDAPGTMSPKPIVLKYVLEVF